MGIHDDNHEIWSLGTHGYLGGELPESHEVLRENLVALQPPEFPYAQQIEALVESLRDLVKVVTNTPVTPAVTSEAFRAGQNTRCLKKQFSSNRANFQGTAPRLLRLRDAPRYLGMDINRFNSEVRPHLTEIPIGKQGIAFDRVDLDAWVAEYKDRNGRPGKAMKGGIECGRRSHQGSSRGVAYGISKKSLEVREFEKAVEQATSRKRNGT